MKYQLPFFGILLGSNVDVEASVAKQDFFWHLNVHVEFWHNIVRDQKLSRVGLSSRFHLLQQSNAYVVLKVDKQVHLTLKLPYRIT